jgi:DNA-binding NtrC family response regulator
MLRSMDPGWELRFCGSAEEALNALAREPHDVIVTDMRMPEMDGASLLDEVSRLYPHVIRIVLSGQATQESILPRRRPRASSTSRSRAMQRPIKAKLRQTVGLRRALSNSSLEALVAQLHDLPSVPNVYVELVEVIRSDRASIHKIGEVIERDAAMTAKVLQLVNSAYFGFHGQITTAAQAVQLLGLDLVRTLMLSAHVFSG